MEVGLKKIRTLFKNLDKATNGIRNKSIKIKYEKIVK
jgi:hypothetical protein